MQSADPRRLGSRSDLPPPSCHTGLARTKSLGKLCLRELTLLAPVADGNCETGARSGQAELDRLVVVQ
jgi:hypothetical protein